VARTPEGKVHSEEQRNVRGGGRDSGENGNPSAAQLSGEGEPGSSRNEDRCTANDAANPCLDSGFAFWHLNTCRHNA
jgi:hypothetical protein